MNVKQMFQNKWAMLSIVALIAVVVAISSYSSSKTNVRDLMADGNVGQDKPAKVSGSSNSIVAGTTPPSVPNSGYAAQPVVNPDELLPKDQNNQFSAMNMVGQSNFGLTDGMLQAGYFIGLDTTGQTLKNANQQLRSDPIIQKVSVGPWNNSTYEPDLGRIPLELGCGAP